MSENKQFNFNGPIPKDRVRTRKGFRGELLSYLEGWYVISLLNEAYGNGQWGYVVDRLDYHGPAQIETQYGPRTQVGATCLVRMTVPAASGPVQIGDVGFGTGIDRDEMAARESAVKEAVTDALKRAAKTLGWPFGLALYDKDQAHVADPDADAKAIEAKEQAEKAALRGKVNIELKRLLPDGTKDDFARAYEFVKGVAGESALDVYEWLRAAKELQLPAVETGGDVATKGATK